jgi:signal transduction histidine kinase
MQAANAQYENLKFQQYNMKGGLSSDNVNCIIQDKEGFLWVGTDNGVNKFDGYNFTNYYNGANDTNSLIHNHILLFYLAADSALWIGTQYGFCYYRAYSDNFFQFRQEGWDGYVRGFFEDEQHRMHMINDRGQIYSIDGHSLRLEREFFFHVYCFLRDSQGILWFGTDEGLFRVGPSDPDPFLYKLTTAEATTQKSVAVFCLLEDGNTIWTGTRGEGIFIIDKSSGEISRFEKKLDFIKSLYKDTHGNILIGDTEGLKIFNKKNHNLLDYRPVEKDKLSLASNAVDAIFEDSQSNLWLGVKFGGIDLAYKDKGFRYIDYNSKDPVYITKKTITAIAADKEDNLWLGAYTNGLERINLRKGSSIYIPYGNKPNELQSGSIYELYNEDDSMLWIGSYFGGLQGYNLRSGKIIHYSHDPSEKFSIAGNDIRSICKDKSGNMWIISHGTGINKWVRKENRFYHFRHDPNDPNSLASDWAFHCICDSKGTIWIATPYGLSVTKDGHTFTNYFHHTEDTTSLISNEVFTVFEDSKHIIWVGTRAGLNRFNPESNNFAQITIKNGLIDNHICSILEDDNGNLWIATKKGLSKWNRSTGRIINFDTGDGLQDNEFMENACLKTRTGHLFFGSVNRGTWFHPDSLSMNKTVPKVFLTDLKLFNQSVPIEPGKKEAILKKHIRFAEKIVLDHTQKVISFEYMALNYIHPEKNSFAYKLENFDKDWNQVGNKREVTYTNLTPGKYIFRVIASNNDGIWNEKGVELKVIILPPFWGTWWFRTLAALSLILALFLIYYLRVQNIKVQNVTLEKTVEIRTQELKGKNEILAKQTKQLHELMVMKDKFFSIIGHDLKNPMNAIKGFTFLLSEEFDRLSDEKRKEYMFHISQSVEKTSNLLDNLLNWAQSQSGIIAFKPSRIDLCELIINNCKLFAELGENKKIGLTNSCNGKSLFVYADPNMLDTVIRNLISNAIKFTPESGKVLINAYKSTTADMVEVVVIDTGIGISAEEAENLFRIDKSTSTAGTAGETGTGLGLILCKEFIEKNGGSIWVKSEPERGSQFYFTVPATKAKTVSLTNIDADKIIT